jgi:plasmid stabilization system protein ParE
MYTTIILNIAKIDIRDSAHWYEQQKRGLGKRFIFQVRTTIHLIQKNPTTFNVKYDDVRTAVLSVFPYMIHYSVDEDNKLVIVSAVFHTSQNPKNWRRI